MPQLAPLAAHLLSILLIVPPPGLQDPAAPPPSQAPQAAKPADSPTPARPTASSRSVRLVVAITTAAEPGATLRRSVTMLVADGSRGSIRSGDQVRRDDGVFVPVGIKVDAGPQVLEDGRIRVFLSLEYSPAYPSTTDSSGQSRDSSGQAQVTAVVADGKPTIVSETTDAASGRKSAVEVTATVLR